ncbi:hypothetical protein WG899_00880 [Paucibacter sp. AS339]|uniref:hypothetical protein n=1 Tax=Paucibacter hankyongi TaxID=3133434 RepID=UPI00309A17E7
MRLRDLHGPDTSAAEFEITCAAWRVCLGRMLLVSSALLTRLALGLTLSRRRAKPELEFYAEAGAPEGALYADGLRVGSLPGVKRL